MNEIRQLLAKKVQAVSDSDFDAVALEVFHYQAINNPLYAAYLQLLRVVPHEVHTLQAIPFLPIQLFKNHIIQTGTWTPEVVFTSSGTGTGTVSSHAVRYVQDYLHNCRRGFAHFYGEPAAYCTLALLPSYLERSGSSLIAMANDFIQRSTNAHSGFFLYNTQALIEILHECKKTNTPTLLLGVSFALLDLAEAHPMNLEGIIIMETGGMKGRRQELIRTDLHERLCRAFRVQQIHSEYGMTELLSQGYSQSDGLFRPAPTVRVYTRQITDPLSPEQPGKTGAINIIDLANLDTIAFIATDDLGKVYLDNSFEILGRLDHSDIRGCNLMVSEAQPLSNLT